MWLFLWLFQRLFTPGTTLGLCVVSCKLFVVSHLRLGCRVLSRCSIPCPIRFPPPSEPSHGGNRIGHGLRPYNPVSPLRAAARRGSRSPLRSENRKCFLWVVCVGCELFVCLSCLLLDCGCMCLCWFCVVLAHARRKPGMNHRANSGLIVHPVCCLAYNSIDA